MPVKVLKRILHGNIF